MQDKEIIDNIKKEIEKIIGLCIEDIKTQRNKLKRIKFKINVN